MSPSIHPQHPRTQSTPSHLMQITPTNHPLLQIFSFFTHTAYIACTNPHPNAPIKPSIIMQVILEYSSSSLQSIHYGWWRLPLQCWNTTWRGRIHLLKKLKVRRGCTVPRPLTWPSTKKSDGTKDFLTTDSMDRCNVLLETQFVGNHLREDITQVLSVGVPFPLGGAAGERSDFNIKQPIGAPLLISPWGYLLTSFPQEDTSAKQRGLEIRVFPLLGELPKGIEPHLPVCQLCRWQLGPNMWTSPTTKSLDPIVVTALRVGFPRESHIPATCGFTCNCPES